MISYLQGTLFRRFEDRIVVLAGGVGYEVLLPEVVRRSLAGVQDGDSGAQVQLHIMFYQSERQPRPVLIGFNNEIEREFFERFISVEGIGPMAAVKAFTLPVPTIAQAIEDKNTATLRSLAGIGARTADKIVASLNGKVGKFCLLPQQDGLSGLKEPVSADHAVLRKEVERVLVEQMGYKVLEAHRMVTDALKHKPSIGTAEELFEEVYRARRQSLG
ncbi:MAG: helix-hairpin-helix domain-containing protein [Armatimonadota bacterium]|nr:helix-hairpin-helix domain-containing protein [Armatimonadota bacterium]